MKKSGRLLLLCCVSLCLLLSVFSACGTPRQPAEPGTESVDYAAQVTLDTSAPTVKCEVTVKSFIDGDTTHFNVPAEVDSTGVFKARYIAINTPESTGKIEEYGKAASRFTREKLAGASSVVIESEGESWELDSTGSRYLAWVWYRNSETEPYRNLNIEILQNGLAIASSSANNRYGETCVAAIAQAKTEKLNIYSGARDPDFYYGTAVELTLRELRCNVADYNGIKVAFEGVVTANDDNSVFVEEYDPESGLYFGITVYYGFGLNGEGLQIISIGNRARIVGTVQFYETGGTYQVSGLSYRLMRPDDPDNLKKLGEGFEPAFVPTDPTAFSGGKVQLTDAEGNASEYGCAELAMSTSVSMDGLKVRSISTTTTEGSSDYGAMTLTCDAGGVTVKIRTAVLYDADRKVIMASEYEGKTINVRGFVDYFAGGYQIRVLSPEHITVIK